MAFLKSLNDKQKEAVLCTDGPLLIIAGAGSGKTRVLTHRIAYLIKEKHVPAGSIMAVTFTNKTAGEMKHRLQHLVGMNARDMWVGTFHSICGRILRHDIEKLGWMKNFVIYDTDDQKSVVKQVLKELDYDDAKFKPKAMLDAISKAKNELISAKEFSAQAADFWSEKVAPVYLGYEAKLKKNNAMDFDDMLMLTVELLSKFKEVADYYQGRFKYISVDEYQDTNRAQYELTKLLAGKHKNICVVGDDDQSIYAFRGADVNNILDFEKDYPDAKVIKLEENYRSTKNILSAANHIIVHNEKRKGKTLWTSNQDGQKVNVYLADDERAEANFIVAQIKKLTGGVDLQNVSILYRTNAQSRVIEESLIREGMPYKVISGFRFYERREIKDLLSLLRAVFNPADDFSVTRLMGFLAQGIGKVTITKIETYAKSTKMTVFDALKEIEKTGVQKKPQEQIKRIVGLAESFMKAALDMSISQLLEMILKDTGMATGYEMEGTDEAISRAENIREFLSIAKDFEKTSEDVSLGAFLTQISLVTDQDAIDENRSYVTLMTMHAAKGLEFPFVFLAGMEEGIFPHFRSMFSPTELEEERRLCYVGVTRAKEQLFITSAKERMLYGESWCNGPSRFLEEIPQELKNEMSPEPKTFTAAATEFVSAGKSYDGMVNLGDMINHPKWGSGEIVKIDGDGEDMTIDIMFAQMGRKTLMMKYAPISMMN